MWSLQHEEITGRRGRRYLLERDGGMLSYGEGLPALRDHSELRTLLSRELASLPYRAFKWEAPALTRATWDRLFEFVVLDSPGLSRNPDSLTFSEYFVDRELVVEFPSLGRDAILIAPCPRGPEHAYVHLGAFVRGAPEAQQHALWQRVGAAMLRRVGEEPVWLSTAGGGVAWLHVRLDDRPKYYGYAPYREYVT